MDHVTRTDDRTPMDETKPTDDRKQMESDQESRLQRSGRRLRRLEVRHRLEEERDK
jgi:hypothetical protein